MPDLLISSTLRVTQPIDIPKTSCGQFPLTRAAQAWTTIWLMLKAFGCETFAARTVPLFPIRMSFKSGASCWPLNLASNPRFFERMQGWPDGWTRSEPLAMEFAPWLQRQRGLLCGLISTGLWDTAEEPLKSL
jgi:hypothetical protein